MSRFNAFFQRLQAHVASGSLIEIDRNPLTAENLMGFPVVLSSLFLVLSVVDDCYFLNGFSVIRLDDVRRYRVLTDREDLIRYALSKRYPGGYLKKPRLTSEEMQDFSFLSTVHGRFPLVTIFREAMDNTVCQIGCIETMKPKTFLLREIDIDGSWCGMRRFRYDDVTRIDVGGTYEEALWMYAEYLQSLDTQGQ